MANLLEQYGIKEVADVVIYEIGEKDDNGQTAYTPVLFLDTLKVSTIEQTAEQAEARGGKGNSPLIIWDYGKEITLNLEDALYSPASMAMMFGDKDVKTDLTTVKKFMTKEAWKALGYEDDKFSKEEGKTKYYDKDMKEITEYATAVYIESEIAASGTVIEINADTFPGTYRLVGDTYARNRNTGKDEYFQFEIKQAKMSSENSITLEAEGDPSVFNMTMRVLRPKDGSMMTLTQYKLPDSTTENG